jgi:hypothetical protein
LRRASVCKPDWRGLRVGEPKPQPIKGGSHEQVSGKLYPPAFCVTALKDPKALVWKKCVYSVPLIVAYTARLGPPTLMYLPIQTPPE